MMNADRLFMLVDTCANIDEVKHEFPDLDFLTYFYALLGYLLSHSDLKRYKKWIYLFGIVGLTIHIIGTWYLSYRIGDIGRTFKGYLNVPCILYFLRKEIMENVILRYLNL